MARPRITRHQVQLAVVATIAFLAGVVVNSFVRTDGDDTTASSVAETTTVTTGAPEVRGSSTTPLPETTEQATTTTERRPEVFVDLAGSDSNDGSADSPLATIETAIGLAKPGDTIFIGGGVYAPVVIDGVAALTFRPADPDDPVTFTSGSYDEGSAIWVIDSVGVQLHGLNATNSFSGILVQRSSDVLISGVTVSNTGQEAVAVQENSSFVTIENSSLSVTGQRPGELDGVPFSNFGEGIYLGTGGVLLDGSLDITTDIIVRGNTIHSTSAEAVDIKASVHNVAVYDNVVFDVSTATSGAIVAGIGVRVYPDPQVTIERNVIFQVSRTSPYRDGTAISVSVPAIVRSNVIWGTQHYGILVDRNLVSENGGEVLVENNFVAETGLDAIRVDATEESVAIRIGENSLGLPLGDFVDVNAPDFIDQALALVARLDAGENIALN